MATRIVGVDVPGQHPITLVFQGGVARCDDCGAIIARDGGAKTVHLTQIVYAKRDEIGAICAGCKRKRSVN